MPRKRSVREDAEASRPRQLRKRLRKAEDQLADAVQKRDRAQARVEALSIIADEIRAQLAEADKSAELEAGVAVPEAEQKPTTTKKPATAAKKPATATKKPATQTLPAEATAE